MNSADEREKVQPMDWGDVFGNGMSAAQVVRAAMDAALVDPLWSRYPAIEHIADWLEAQYKEMTSEQARVVWPSRDDFLRWAVEVRSDADNMLADDALAILCGPQPVYRALRDCALMALFSAVRDLVADGVSDNGLADWIARGDFARWQHVPVDEIADEWEALQQQGE